MTDTKPQVPIRLVAIAARVPTGETCDGCEHLGHAYQEHEMGEREIVGDMCLDFELSGKDLDYDANDHPRRLPECKARDRFVITDPESTNG